MPESSAPSRRLPPRLIGALVVALVVVIGLGVAWPLLLRLEDLDPDAEWIWAPLTRVDGRPLAFLAVRDFELSDPPTTATLRIQADEEYLLRVNGEWLGAGGMSDGRADAYPVGDLLRSGNNRILVELRSTRGVGAFFLSLVDAGQGRVLVRSGGDWWIFWHQRKALDDLARPVDRGAEPHVWGRSPVGRWLGPLRATRRPRLDRLSPAEARDPAEIRQWNGERWLRRPHRARTLGRRVRFSWSEPVTGHLTLSSRLDEVPPALVYFGLDELPDPIRQAPGAVRIQVPGRRHWTDTSVRTFRHVLVVGPAALAGARVVAVAGPPSPLPIAGPGAARGVFGLEPPRLRTPVEDEVWSDLERLQGETRGEPD